MTPPPFLLKQDCSSIYMCSQATKMHTPVKEGVGLALGLEVLLLVEVFGTVAVEGDEGVAIHGRVI